MRILFLHEVGYLEKPIFEMHEFPEHLANMGHTIGFLDFTELRASKSERDLGRQIKGRVLEAATLHLFSQRSLAPGILGRLTAVVMFPFFFLKVLKQFAPEIVVSFSVPTSGWQAAIICKVLRIPLVFRALDVSHKIRGTLFAPLVKLAERVVYSTATHVSCNNPAMLSYCRSLGATTQRSSVELPPLDLSHFLSGYSDRGKLRKELGIAPNEKVLMYMGTFFYFSGLDEVIRGLGKLSIKPRLVLIGGGERDTHLRTLTKDLGLTEVVTFTGFVNFEDLPRYLSIADIAINPMVPTLVSNAALPNKVLQYMASGLPVVSTLLDGLHSIFPVQPGIKYVQCPELVLEGAAELLEANTFGQLGEANRDAVASTLSLEASVRRFENLLKRIGSLA